VTLAEQLRDERLGRLTDLRDLDPQLPLTGLQMPRAKPVALPRHGVRATLIPGATEPAVELFLDRPLDDQPGAEPGELGQHLLRILDHPGAEQPIDLRLYLR